jgi:hypothetical protein
MIALQLDKEPDDKGKPSERKGRKAMGLSLIRGKIARLPKQDLLLRPKPDRQIKEKGVDNAEIN